MFWWRHHAVFSSIFTLILLSVGGYYLGRKRALAVADGHIRNLHSLPASTAPMPRYGAVYLLIVFAVWTALQPSILIDLVVAGLPAELRDLPPDRLNLLVNDLKKPDRRQHRVQHARPGHAGGRRPSELARDWQRLALDRGSDPRHRRYCHAWRTIAPMLRARKFQF